MIGPRFGGDAGTIEIGMTIAGTTKRFAQSCGGKLLPQPHPTIDPHEHSVRTEQ